jgi:hypothetical protein
MLTAKEAKELSKANKKRDKIREEALTKCIKGIEKKVEKGENSHQVPYLSSEIVAELRSLGYRVTIPPSSPPIMRMGEDFGYNPNYVIRW